jgi:DNA-binding beta-propeller fold protein YncE
MIAKKFSLMLFSVLLSLSSVFSNIILEDGDLSTTTSSSSPLQEEFCSVIEADPARERLSSPLYISDIGSHSVSIVNNNRVVDTINVGNYGTTLAVSKDRLYVGCSGFGHDKLRVFNRITKQLITDISLNISPDAMTIYDNKLFASGNSDHKMIVIDCEKNTVIEELDLSSLSPAMAVWKETFYKIENFQRPYKVMVMKKEPLQNRLQWQKNLDNVLNPSALVALENELYVSDNMKDEEHGYGRVSVFDTKTNTLIKKINVIPFPTLLAYSKKNLFVCNWQGKAQNIDPISGQVIGEMSLNTSMPTSFAIAPNMLGMLLPNFLKRLQEFSHTQKKPFSDIDVSFFS